jgi:hypothetical protein
MAWPEDVFLYLGMIYQEKKNVFLSFTTTLTAERGIRILL